MPRTNADLCSLVPRLTVWEQEYRHDEKFNVAN